MRLAMPAVLFSRFRLWVRLVAGCLLLPVALAVSIGCTTTVVAPGSVKQPVTVFLLDHGRTPSLVLPAEPGRMVRYMYGDWEWYARSNTTAWRGFLALFVPTQGTLGRDEFPAVKSADALPGAVAVGIEELFPIEVERERAAALRQEIEAEFESQGERSVWSAESRARFVPHPQKYTWFTNSNQMMAEWLRALGCATRGPAFYSRWKVERPQQHSASE